MDFEVKVKVVYGLWNSILRSVTCHMGSHRVTCHSTQVNTTEKQQPEQQIYHKSTTNRSNGAWVKADNVQFVYRSFSVVLNSCKVFAKSRQRLLCLWVQFLVKNIIFQSVRNCISYTISTFYTNIVMFCGFDNSKQDATLTQGPPRDAPNIWVPWK